jgi:hypothetical protein
MKAEIIDRETIKLIPENNTENVLLLMFAEKNYNNNFTMNNHCIGKDFKDTNFELKRRNENANSY